MIPLTEVSSSSAVSGATQGTLTTSARLSSGGVSTSLLAQLNGAGSQSSHPSSLHYSLDSFLEYPYLRTSTKIDLNSRNTCVRLISFALGSSVNRTIILFLLGTHNNPEQ